MLKKILSTVILVSLSFNANALKIGDKLMDCNVYPDDTYDRCKVIAGDLENIPIVKGREDILLTYKLKYNYSCNDNITQGISIKGTYGSPVLFEYNGSNLEVTSAGKLSVVDVNPRRTYAAQFVNNCNLHVQEIEADLSKETVNALIKDACYIGTLNNLNSQAQIIIYLTQSLVNNIGGYTIPQLKNQLDLLTYNLNSILDYQTDENIKQQVNNIIGNENTRGTIKYILNNIDTWGLNSFQLKNNLNLFYSSISNIMNEISDENTKKIKSLYENGLLISNDRNNFKSARLPFSNLNYQYKLSRREDVKDYIKPICSN
nr:hypothetical protein GTC16762_33600 [Pigmentibacter ruber]